MGHVKFTKLNFRPHHNLPRFWCICRFNAVNSKLICDIVQQLYLVLIWSVIWHVFGHFSVDFQLIWRKISETCKNFLQDGTSDFQVSKTELVDVGAESSNNPHTPAFSLNYGVLWFRLRPVTASRREYARRFVRDCLRKVLGSTRRLLTATRSPP